MALGVHFGYSHADVSLRKQPFDARLLGEIRTCAKPLIARLFNSEAQTKMLASTAPVELRAPASAS